MDINAVDRNAPALHAPAPVTTVDKAAENREIVQAVKAVNGTEMFGQDNELMFQRDLETKRMVVRVVNRKTGEVITQVPSEHVLRLADDLTPKG
jgi:uncharacterized FlaG/YvyC family protein